MLQRMNELAVKSANGTNSEDDRNYIQAEVDQLVTEIDRVATTTKFNETYLLKGNGGELKFTNGAATITVDGGALGASVFDASGNANLGTTTYAATASVATDYTAAVNSIQVGSTTYKYVSSVAGRAAVSAADAAKTLTTGANKAFDNLDDMLTAIQRDNNTNIKTISGTKTNGADTYDLKISAFADKNADLSFSLHVGADSTKDNKIEVNVGMMSARGLGINGIKVYGSDGSNATGAIDTIANAIKSVSSARSSLGAVQNRLEHTINNLDNVVENTTSAESAIRDTDMATEMVSYSNNNILAQAGQAMLAQANQSNQGVLSLLG